MLINNTKSFNVNTFLNYVNVKKQYLKQLNNKIYLIDNIKKKDFKTLNINLFFKKPLSKDKLLVKYVLDISFLKTNTFMHVIDCNGNIKFFYSAGSLNYKGKQKLSRILILKKFYKIIVSQLKFLKNQPVAIHFKNTGFKIFWLLRKLKKKMFIIVIKTFNSNSYNGCRRKKVRRKKIKSLEEMVEWFKAADCKSVELSHRRFKSFFLQKVKKAKYNAAVACLLWEQKVMCSNHIISIL